MKKNILKISVCLLVLLITYTACNEENLTLQPGVVTADNYFKSEADFRTAIIGAYSTLTDYYSSSNSGSGGQAESVIFYLPGDDLTINNTEAYEIFGSIGPNEGKLSSFYKSSYILVNRANLILERLSAADASVFTTTTPINVKKSVEGEALFLRGFANYMLWNTFGTAPLTLKNVSDLAQINNPSTKGTQLLDQAITDFSAAAALLPNSWDSQNLGRVTANSANGMLGKALVFRATVNKAQVDYQAAIAAFSKISGVSLVANFGDNFDFTKENGAESLFEFQSGGTINGLGTTNVWLSNTDANIGVASSYFASFDPGNFANYMGGGVYTVTTKLVNSFNAGDPRAPQTYKIPTSNIAKYILKSKMEGQNYLNNTVILRLADVKLLWAEALLASGNPGAALQQINDVRTRARNMATGGMIPVNFDASVTDRNTIFGWIMDERLRELAAEGQRWYDLRRWALGGSISLNNAYFSSSNATNMKWDNKYLFFPIPQSELNLNPNIIQNPGY